MKNFKPHMMYSGRGKGVQADTYEKHLALKKKGYSHTEPSTTKKVKRLTRKKSGGY